MRDKDILALHKKYASSDRAFELVYTHCEIVCRIALDTAKRNNLSVDIEILKTAAMLHDIGTYALYIDELDTFQKAGYMQHALLGAALLQEEGLPDSVTSAVKTHILMGLSAEEVKKHRDGRHPYIDLTAKSIEAELLCYADRFHSKDPVFHDIDIYLIELQRGLPLQAKKLRHALDIYDAPDISLLAKEYGHPII